MANVGTAVLDFGAAPGGNYATVAVTGETGVTSTSVADAWLMFDSTADHNAVEHLLAGINVRAGSIVAGTGFTIYGQSDLRLTGLFNVHWCWV